MEREPPRPPTTIRPAITMTMEMTDAKIGRLMKKRDMDGAPSALGRRGGGGGVGAFSGHQCKSLVMG